MQFSKVNLIFKGGDRNNLSNYRPISVLPVFSKGLEKLLHARIWFHNKCQYGFRKGRSTELALLTQKEIILHAFDKKQLVIVVYIDFSKAFDRLNHATLLEKLERYGIRGIPLSLLTSYLQHRRQCVRIGDSISSLKTTSTGVPQGSILGPLRFNLYVNDIVKVSTQPKYVIYADDVTLPFSNTELETLQSDVNNCLKSLSTWSYLNSLHINVTKTKAVLFSPKQSRREMTHEIILGQSAIEVVECIKTLGVYFHKHMLWDTHVNHVTKQLSKCVGVMAKLRTLLPSI